MPPGDKDIELQAKIVVTADNRGTGETVAGMHSVENAARSVGSTAEGANRKVGESSKEAGDHVRELGHHFHEGAAAAAVLSEVAEGNIGALAHLGTAIKTLGTLLKTNLIGTLFTLGAIAAQVILPLVAGFDSVEKKIEATRASADKLAKANMDSLTEQLAAVAKYADEARKKFEAAIAAKERLENAEQATELAEIRANPNLTEVQRAEAESATREKYRRADQNRKLEVLEYSVKAAEKDLADKKETGIRPEQDLKDAIAEWRSLEAKRAPLDELERLKEMEDTTFGRGEGVTLEPASEYRKRLADLTPQIAGKNLPSKGEVAAAKETVEKLLESANKSLNEQAEAQRQLEAARDQLELEKQTQTKENSFIERQRAAELLPTLNVARSKDEQQVSALRTARQQADSLDTKRKQLETEIGQLERNLSLRPGLSTSDANRPLLDQLNAKKAELATIDPQRLKAQNDLNALLKTSPKSLIDAAQKPDLDALTKTVSSQKENTDAIAKLTGVTLQLVASIQQLHDKVQIGGPSEAAPGTFKVNGETRKIETGGTATIDGAPIDAQEDHTATINGRPVGPLSSTASIKRGDTTYALDRASGKMVEQTKAIESFADTVAANSRRVSKKLDQTSRQITNGRE